MNPISISIPSLLLAAGLAAQTGVPGIVLESARHKFVLVQAIDGHLCGMGADYTAQFLADRVDYFPNLVESPVDPTLRLRARAAGRGARVEALPAPAAPVADGLVVRYARGAVTETYAMRAEAMEQSFVFDRLPGGDGDLVVDVQLDTALPLQVQGDDALVFGDANGSVRIDGVVGIDAAGKRTPGSLGFANGVLTLRLPGDFVRRAALPLVLDPLITTTTQLTAAVDEGIDGSYDASTGTWCAVWKQRNSPSGTSPFSVRGWLEPGGAVLIDSDGVLTHPVVANNNARNAFVVAWTEADGVWVRALQSASVLGAARRLNAAVGPLHESLGIANNVSTSDDRMILCSRMTASGVASANLYTFAVAPSLTIGGIGNGNASNQTGIYGQVGAVAIASNGGTNGEYLVCWGQQVGANYDLLSRLFSQTGSPVTGEVGILAPGSDLPEIRVDGENGHWMAVFNSTAAFWPYPKWIYLMGIDRQVAGTLLQRTPVLIEGLNGGGRLDIALAGTRAVVAFVRVLIAGCTSTSGQCASSRLASYTLSECLPCQPSEEWGVLSYFAALVRPAASGDAANPELVRAYTSLQTRMTLDNQVGVVTDLGGGCGGLQMHARAECAKIGGNFEAVLEGSSPSNWLIVGTARGNMTGCGSCVLVPDPYTSTVIGPLHSLQGLASQAFAVPPVASLIGMTFFQQWLVQNPQTPGCPSFPFSFSNALQVQIQ